MPARDVIRYTLFKVTSIDELDARTSSCNDSETALTSPIEYMYPPKWLRSLFITDQLIDSFHIVTSLSNRSSIEKSIKSFLQMKGQIAY